MIGHEFRFTQTNLSHWIAICSCGWTGAVSPWRTIRNARTKRETLNLELTVDALRGEWDRHVVSEEKSIVERSEQVLAANAAAVDKLIPTVLRPGRFGGG